ncbi:MAG: hypothetical protein ABJP70_13195 [Erythrobacter sp.]
MDVRSGVPIGPRSIRNEPTPTPTTTPPASAPTTISEPESVTPTPSATTQSTQPQGERATPAAPRFTGAQSNTPTAARQTVDGRSDTPAAIVQDGETVTVTDTTPVPRTPNEATGVDEPDAQTLPSANDDALSTSSGFSLREYWPWIAGFAGLLILLLGGWLWRKRRVASAPSRIEPSNSDSVNPVPEVTAAPDRPNLTLEIISATRSFMMFTVEFRVTFANRTDRAVRDLSLSAQLASARRSGNNALPTGTAQPIGKIERIGPHQSRSLSGKIQLPMSQVEPLRQGKKPLLVPLLHLMLDGDGQSATSRSFVMGLPSTTAQGRVHPIPLDVPPGGLPDLKVREIALSDGQAQPEPEAA